MRSGLKVRIKPEAWAKRQAEWGTQEPCPEELEVLHTAGELTSLRGYVWLGMGLFWWRLDDLV